MDKLEQIKQEIGNHVEWVKIPLKEYADINDTIASIQRIVREYYKTVRKLAEYLRAKTDKQTFQNIWEYVRNNVRYQNDEKGKETLRRPYVTVYGQVGDCDDMSILISAILLCLDYKHDLFITAYAEKNKWQHIYPVAYDSEDNRFVIDCVPEIPWFNYEAHPIKNKIIIDMNLEELGSLSNTEMINELTEPFDMNNLEGVYDEEDDISLLQGLLGSVAIVDEDEEYDTVLSGSQLKHNIILNQLVEAKRAIESEIRYPTDISEISDHRIDLQLINNIIENFDDEDGRDEAIRQAIQKGTLYRNFYKAIQYGISDLLEGLSGEQDEDDLYYLKLMDQEGELDELLDDDYEEDDSEHDEGDTYEEVEGFDDLGRSRKRKKKKGGFFKKIGKKIKKGVQKFKEKHPKLAKFGHALKKYSPATFASRKSLEVFMRANTFHMAEKLAIGYSTEAQAKKLGYTKAEWLRFVEGKNKAEKRWYALGGKKDYFRKMILGTRAAKKAGLGELGVASAIITAVTKVFGGIIKFFKNMKLKKKDGTEREETAGDNLKTKSATVNHMDMENGIEPERADSSSNKKTDEKSGVTEETITDDSGNETTVYKDKDGNEISKYKAFFLKNKIWIFVVSSVVVFLIVVFIIWKIRKKKSLEGLGKVGLSEKQKNRIRRQGLNKRAHAALVREEIKKDGKSYNTTNRKAFYKKIFTEAFKRPISPKQEKATLNFNRMYGEVRKRAKELGGGSSGWTKAWAEIKKKSRG